MPGRALLGAAVLLLVGASTAHAGTLTIVNTIPPQQRGSLLYEAAPGEANQVTVSVDAVGALHLRDDGASIAIPAPIGVTIACATLDPHEAVCVDPQSALLGQPPLEMRLGDRDDHATVPPGLLATVRGGDGADTLNGGWHVYGDAGDDTITGGSELHGGAGDDAFRLPAGGLVYGDDGDDSVAAGTTSPQSYGFTVQFDGGPGADRLVSAGRRATLDVRGGSGPDTAVPGEGDFLIWDYSHDGRTSGVKVTQDGLADDGAPGEGDNVPPAWGTITGTNFADDISESPLGGSITALGGDDTLHALYPAFTWFGGNDGDDKIYTRDGFRDATFCAGGNDVAIVDAVDDADSSCETRKVG